MWTPKAEASFGFSSSGQILFHWGVHSFSWRILVNSRSTEIKQRSFCDARVDGPNSSFPLLDWHTSYLFILPVMQPKSRSPRSPDPWITTPCFRESGKPPSSTVPCHQVGNGIPSDHTEAVKPNSQEPQSTLSQWNNTLATPTKPNQTGFRHVR